MTRPLRPLPPADLGDLCDLCGGDRRVAEWPMSRAQKGYVDAVASRGTVTEAELKAYLSTGHFPGPVDP